MLGIMRGNRGMLTVPRRAPAAQSGRAAPAFMRGGVAKIKRVKPWHARQRIALAAILSATYIKA